MKRLFVFILIVLLLCGINLSCTQNLNLERIFGGAEVEVYLSERSPICEFETINNGEGQVVFAKIENLSYILSSYKCSGFTIITDLSLCKVIEEISPNYYFENKNGIYGYLNGIKESVIVKDKKVNFQCAESGGFTKIGFPILLGGY